MQALDISLADLRRLEAQSKPGPRYTSYPTALSFSEELGPSEYAAMLEERRALRSPLSLYLHIPFCENICLYCACSVVYTANHRRAAPYIELLKREIALTAAHCGSQRRVEQLHLGGGTPTFLEPQQLLDLISALRDSFDIANNAELSIELDPRVTSDEHLAALAQVGFRRASLGVQDFAPQVQEAIHRQQSEELVANLAADLRRRGFESLNFDLIYGLPRQSEQSFLDTVRRTLALGPDRISLFHFAYLPGVVKHQQRIRAEELPDAEARLRIFYGALQLFLEAGYEAIGMDHFAKPGDELAIAARRGALHRNFQGYTTRGDLDLIGLGLTAIGDLKDAYFQNQRGLSEYEQAIGDGQLATQRGVRLTEEDKLRRAVIQDIMCRASLSFAEIDARFGLDSRRHFQEELRSLHPLIEEGLLRMDDQGLLVNALGRFALRNIAMVFDARLAELNQKAPRFSRTV
ncbi:MAG: oxygen-independent coproporphyrinogen III oxidase [Leptospirales bacterium]|nr:oxygen-independent coproporphyrinogen III oxidase [Leptospirales bacterium]